MAAPKLTRTVAVTWTFSGEPGAVEDAAREWESDGGILDVILARGPNGPYATREGARVHVDVRILREGG